MAGFVYHAHHFVNQFTIFSICHLNLALSELKWVFHFWECGFHKVSQAGEVLKGHVRRTFPYKDNLELVFPALALLAGLSSPDSYAMQNRR